ncbi:di-heme oxidoredictase family protein [Devosia sp. ZB163]|uniref:di-heme oxidoreductase family protein n=1 Tax=Devosia sp. ZB163 TaxID=3025938 RepID=UPI00235E0650|nr:di-heme oxidoredictase family protein [Devosia sp. ZB163]MDC9825446.1 di-heme oxidoredictase family protein [Devosia sp. ZB163]
MHMRLTAFLVITLIAGLAFATEGGTRSDLTPKDLERVRAVTAPATDFSKPENFEQLPAGAATVKKRVNQDIFSFSSANLTFEQEEQFKLGNALFRKLWVSSPASTEASDGLGPLFNARGCQNCHLKDGRGHTPSGAGDNAVSMFLRLSVPAHGEADQQALAEGAKVIPEPTYGGQLQDFAVQGLKPEGRMAISYTDEPVTLGDGTVVTLRRPDYSVTDLAYGPMADDVMLSPRVAPQMIGLGLLEQVPAEDILANADPDDRDGDGISGRANFATEEGVRQLGRFGWKAGTASIRAQSADAFAGDIGIATPPVMKPHGDCTAAQADCLAAPTGEQERLGPSEAPDPVLELVTFYSQNLGVPQRRNVGNPEILRGKQAFYEANCISCHTPKFVTSRDAPTPAHRFQLVWPYSDLLLHDMGDGLADHRPEGEADGYEWRTPPLWGIGLTETVSGHTEFLHDGRARNLTEAILWHGGEAQAARDAFAQMSKSERDDLVAFLESL